MLRRSSAIILSAALLLVGCGGNKALVAQKDAEIARLQGQVEKSKTEQKEQAEKADQLAADLNKQLTDLKQKGQAWVTEKENLTIITLPNAALFTSGSVRLTPEGKKAIDEVWKVLAKYPDRDVSIRGHTDHVPIAQKFQWKYKSNWELSSARAHTVLHYVLKKQGGKPGRLNAAGYGEHRPVGDNKTEEGRKKYRRVVIAVGPKIS